MLIWVSKEALLPQECSHMSLKILNIDFTAKKFKNMIILIFLCIFKNFLCIFKIKRGDLNTLLFTKVFMFLDSADKNQWENEQFEII